MVMLYAPHILEIESHKEPQRDEKGNTIPGTGGSSWEEIGRCRCDDNNSGERVGVSGTMIEYVYHIVVEGRVIIPIGSKVRALEKDGSIRGEGSVIRASKCNYMNYSEIWV